MADNILEVRKLKLSFRTNNGTVKAIRDISFDLKRGETLAIVGESGSGKSVTSKAILGISAGNAIIDSGEILYDGKDLLKISENEMYKIRGDKISMIFQDPLSSLDPIVKIGKQIIEALILKNRDSRKMARKEFAKMIGTMEKDMVIAFGAEEKAQIDSKMNIFKSFVIIAQQLEYSYNESATNATETLSLLDDLLFLAEKNQKIDISGRIKDICNKLNKITDVYFIFDKGLELSEFKLKLTQLAKDYKGKYNINVKVKKMFKDVDTTSQIPVELVEELKIFRQFIFDLNNQQKPNFFRLGYYLYSNPDTVYAVRNEEDNIYLLTYLNENFMNDFINLVIGAVKVSFNKSLEYKKEALIKLGEAKEFFKKNEFTKKEALNVVKELKQVVNNSIDQLVVIKDSVAYTFGNSLYADVMSYYAAKKNNVIEEKKFNKQTKKYNALINKGKNVDWKVIPMKIVELSDVIENIVAKIERLEAKYQEDINSAESYDFNKASIDLIDHLKAKASEIVYKVTKSIAKEKAIKLMEEVGISEPRIRYNQYPFEFSGGMRQRIVIAIALASNPDILICDEPTTALDVTIQSQILELINKLKVERNLSVIFITHDLGVVANMADRIAVMYAGKIVEYGTSEEIFYSPAHPYTWALLSSMPDLDTTEKLDAIPGTPPDMLFPPVGDAFAARNKYAMQIDFEKQPPLFKITDTHYAATWLLHPNAPKVEMPKIISDRIKRMRSSGGKNDE